MEQHYSIGFAIKGIEQMMKRSVGHFAKRSGVPDVTPMHCFVLHYLNRNADHDIYQKELEHALHLTRSSITGIMKELEHEGFIKRESVPTDARLKKIILLPAGQEINRKMKTAIEESEQRIDAALTPDEKKQFLSYCDKIRTTLEQYEDNKEDNE